MDNLKEFIAAVEEEGLKQKGPDAELYDFGGGNSKDLGRFVAPVPDIGHDGYTANHMIVVMSPITEKTRAEDKCWFRAVEFNLHSPTPTDAHELVKQAFREFRMEMMKLQSQQVNVPDVRGL